MRQLPLAAFIIASFLTTAPASAQLAVVDVPYAALAIASKRTTACGAPDQDGMSECVVRRGSKVIRVYRTATTIVPVRDLKTLCDEWQDSAQDRVAELEDTAAASALNFSLGFLSFANRMARNSGASAVCRDVKAQPSKQELRRARLKRLLTLPQP
jgi:hypothetical protein